MASRRGLIALAALCLACPAPRDVAGTVYGSAIGGGPSLALAKPLAGATVTWECPAGLDAPAKQTMQTDSAGAFASKDLGRALPGACEIVVSKEGFIPFREHVGALCTDPPGNAEQALSGTGGACRRVRIAIGLVDVAAAAAHAVPLDAPRAAGGAEVQTVMSIVLAADGATSVDGKTVPNDDALLALARDAHGKNPELRAVIKADAAVPHGRVIHVLDLLKQAQVSKIAFGVSPI